MLKQTFTYVLDNWEWLLSVSGYVLFLYYTLSHYRKYYSAIPSLCLFLFSLYLMYLNPELNQASYDYFKRDWELFQIVEMTSFNLQVSYIPISIIYISIVLGVIGIYAKNRQFWKWFLFTYLFVMLSGMGMMYFQKTFFTTEQEIAAYGARLELAWFVTIMTAFSVFAFPRALEVAWTKASSGSENGNAHPRIRKLLSKYSYFGVAMALVIIVDELFLRASISGHAIFYFAVLFIISLKWNVLAAVLSYIASLFGVRQLADYLGYKGADSTIIDKHDIDLEV